MTQKYYLIETEYVGPNPDQNLNKNTVAISTTPALTNLSGEEKIQGWCGTTNDWSIDAHGEYDSIEDARKAIDGIFGVVRDYEGDLDDDIVEQYLVGEYTDMSREATGDWVYEALKSITADTTDAELSALEIELRAGANLEGCDLHEDLIDMMTRSRDELIEARDEAEEA